jgi:uncharacterized DUF497 family protein
MTDPDDSREKEAGIEPGEIQPVLVEIGQSLRLILGSGAISLISLRPARADERRSIP